MKLIPFSARYLRLAEPLPFGLRDAAGRLLLSAGQALSEPAQLQALAGQPLFCDESESLEWHRRLQGALDEAMRRGERLGQLAAVRLPGAAPRPTAQRALSFAEQWEDMALVLDAALRELPATGEALRRIAAVQAQVAQLAQRRPDGSLYHLVYHAGQVLERYSAHHALLCALICLQTAPLLGFDDAQREAVCSAALTMNVSMPRLQDLLATSDMRPTAEMRQQIETHPQAGAAILAAAGVQDALWLEIVRLHHDDSQAAEPLAALPPGAQLARLLRRVDVFTAKLSRRRTRAPMSPVQAAREACLGRDGRPDEVGAALLRSVGLYPPGSFVELASGERGIVLARGSRANLPVVAALVNAAGAPLAEPLLRDTIDKRHAVRSAVLPDQVRVRPPHDKLLAMR